MVNYCSKIELVEEIRILQTEGTISPRLIEIVRAMCLGVQQRFGRGIDSEELTQNFWLVLIKKKHRIDLEKNVFSYITTCIFNELMRLHREFKKQPLYVDGEQFHLIDNPVEPRTLRKTNHRSLKCGKISPPKV